MIKSVVTKIINIISVIIIVIAVAILLSVVFTKPGEIPSIMGHSFMKVLTGSMEPEIPANSIVITEKVDPSNVKVGDIITFYSRDAELKGVPVTHRVIEIDQKDNQQIFTTKGDINALPDDNPVYAEDIIGKVVFSSYTLGALVKLITNPLVFFPLVSIPLLLLIIDSIRKAVISAKQIAEDDQGRR